MRCRALILLLAVLTSFGCSAAAAPHTQAQLLLAAESARAGETVLAGVQLKMSDGWHTYGPDPEDSGQATEIKWQLPPGVTAGKIQWPAAKKTVADGLTSYAYYEEVILLVPLQLAADLPPGPLELTAAVSWIECLEQCVPGDQSVTARLTIGNETKPSPAAATLALWQQKPPHVLPGAPATNAPAQTQLSPASSAAPDAPVSLWTMLLFAFVGGLILNLMPCVLPVIALKILGFVSQASESPARIRKLGLIYAGGVLVSFLALAAVVIAVQSTGHRASWGMQFSNPPFLVALTALVTLVALNLFGVFEVTLGGGAMDAAGKLASKHGATGAFFNGVLATVLATPCTAPFLAPALGFAFAQPPGVVVGFFATIAAGLAAPYVVLTWQPAWLKFLPKPGAWMEKFKIIMGFPMLGTAVWLYDVASSFYGERTWWLGLFLIGLALAAWVFGEFIQRGRGGKTFARVTVVVLLLGGYGYALEGQLHWRTARAEMPGEPLQTNAEGIDWQRWSPAAVTAARAQGRPVLVDFTARWCLTCRANKALALEIPAVQAKLRELKAEALLGDYTHFPEDIGAELARFGRAGVPLVLVYPADASKPPRVLPAVLTPGIVLEALAEARR